MPRSARGALAAAPLSLYAFARHVGVDVEQVLKGVRNGRLELSVGTNARGKPCIVDGVLAEREWRRNRDMRKVRGPEVTMASERKRLLSAQALSAELDYATKSGQLISVREATEYWTSVILDARTKLLGLPSRVKQRCPHFTSADLGVIDALIREILTELADGRHVARGNRKGK